MIFNIIANLLGLIQPNGLVRFNQTNAVGTGQSFRGVCPRETTKYKIVSYTGSMGDKFTCPPQTVVGSCNCVLTMLDRSKIGKNVEVDHPNPRVCSCRHKACGENCIKVVTKVFCCGEKKRCPMNEVNRPSHRTDWTCILDVRRRFGKYQKPLQKAIAEGAEYVRQFPNESINIMIRKGMYIIDNSDEAGIILRDINPDLGGRFIISGEGKDSTILKFSDWRQDMMYIQNVSRLTVKGIHFSRLTPGATQGFVVRADTSEVLLDIPPGFPLPNSLYNGEYETRTRTYLRKYVNPADPQVQVEDNFQVPWSDVVQVNTSNPRLWSFRLRRSPTAVPTYNVGDLIAVKSKCCGFPRSCAYIARESVDILFQDLRWTRQSRGVFRKGTQRVTILDCEILRDTPEQGIGWALSSSAGGPQFGQPNDPWMHNVRVENFYAENTGDDSLAFFNVQSFVALKNITIRDSFSRSLLFYRSAEPDLQEVNVIRSPICYNNNEEDIRKIYDFEDNTRIYRTLSYFNPSRFAGDPDGLLGSNCTLPYDDRDETKRRNSLPRGDYPQGENDINTWSLHGQQTPR